MNSKLENIYTRLIENRKHHLQGWHDHYCEFIGEVEKIRERIKKGDSLSHEKDKDFLRRLLCERANGIASRGQSVLSNDNFKSFIQNKNFLSSLQNLILSPNKENFTKFSDTWSDQGKGNNPVLVNRATAACTLEVSTTVVTEYFDQIFSRLIHEEIIPPYNMEDGTDWFSKNIFLMKSIKSEFSEKLKDEATDEYFLNMLVWEMYANMSNPFSLKKQVIKYGPPGTGKTYQARQQTSLFFDIWKTEFDSDSDQFTYEDQYNLIQFHPSYSYEDFIEGLRPTLENDGSVQLKLQNGVFKEFCREAGKWEIDVQEIRPDLDWESLTINDLKPHQNELSGTHWQHIFGIKDKSKHVSKAVPPFFFIIDEINRAELSRVFGELMYSLEYRGVKGSIKTQYAKLNNKENGMLDTAKGFQFFVPSNIYLIGTMNTIDRSVESFDFALRRRFHWEEVRSNIELLRHHLLENKWDSLADNLNQLNTQIAKEPLLGADYQIGHAYFMNLKYSTNLSDVEVRRRVWKDSIRPLLQEYLRGTGKENDLITSLQKAFEGKG